MADYREFSQQYAQGAFRAVAVLNGGATFAVLTQLSPLFELGLQQAVARSVTYWSIGLWLGTSCWLWAFLSTRYVDKSDLATQGGEVGRAKSYLWWADFWMYAGMFTFYVSAMLFGIGAYIMTIAAAGLPLSE
jgi:hypothetical protein